MKTLKFCCHALSIVTASLILAACGGSGQTPISVASSAVAAPRHHHSITFNYAGAQQNFTVPTGVTYVTVKAYGGSSGSGPGGGYVRATIPVTPGESLAIFVGGNPGCTSGGGFNGGGPGGVYNGEGGAGASDVRQGGNALTNRVVVAGGGGGAGAANQCQGGAGGAGGGLVGGSGGHGSEGSTGGGGGGQSAGGTGGQTGCSGHYANGQPGALGLGGRGGGGRCAGGGGGGGGYYGGGGGGAGGTMNPYGAGGGGGSSYIEPSARNATNQQGGSGSGLVIISW